MPKEEDSLEYINLNEQSRLIDQGEKDTKCLHQVVTKGFWKPARNISYETLALTTSQLNCKIRPAGFRSNAAFRQLKKTCLLSQIRARCALREQNPRMAVCITMYNEDEREL